MTTEGELFGNWNEGRQIAHFIENLLTEYSCPLKLFYYLNTVWNRKILTKVPYNSVTISKT